MIIIISVYTIILGFLCSPGQNYSTRSKLVTIQIVLNTIILKSSVLRHPIPRRKTPDTIVIISYHEHRRVQRDFISMFRLRNTQKKKLDSYNDFVSAKRKI